MSNIPNNIKRKIFIEKDTDTVNAAVMQFLGEHKGIQVKQLQIKKHCEGKEATLDFYDDETNPAQV